MSPLCLSAFPISVWTTGNQTYSIVINRFWMQGPPLHNVVWSVWTVKAVNTRPCNVFSSASVEPHNYCLAIFYFFFLLGCDCGHVMFLWALKGLSLVCFWVVCALRRDSSWVHIPVSLFWVTTFKILMVSYLRGLGRIFHSNIPLSRYEQISAPQKERKCGTSESFFCFFS